MTTGVLSHGRRSRPRKVATTIALALIALLALGAPSALAAGDANKAKCPAKTEESPGFRSYLPDCRAYELVSPGYVAGFEVIGGVGASINAAPVSVSGDRVGGVSLGSFAGNPYAYTTGGTFGNVYAFGRGLGGWEDWAVMPTVAQLPSPNYEDSDPELRRSVWTSGNNPYFGERTEPNRVFVREADGRLVDVGRITPTVVQNGGYKGASADLSRIVLALGRGETDGAGVLWPGDGTIGGPSKTRVNFSLYEYDGVGASEPSLVGVRNEGSLGVLAAEQHLEHVNDVAEQISECGTFLGSVNGTSLLSESADTYNAISPSGFGVFFTARAGGCKGGVGLAETGSGPSVNELYVRVGGVRTLAISEPSLSVPGRQCTGVCAESEREENGHVRGAAVFAGASMDGHRVFFTTSQPLVNEDGDTTSDLYMEELTGTEVARIVDVSAGDPATDATPGVGAEVRGVSRVAEDGSRVYFVAKGVLTTAANANGEAAAAAANNLYVYDVQTGRTAFVARLANGDETSVWKAEAFFREAQISDNGRYFVFVSRAHLAGTGDTSGTGTTVGQLFRYDAVEGSLVRVSVGQKGEYLCSQTGKVEEGYNCNGNVQSNLRAPKIRQQKYSGGDKADQPYMEVNVASDGSVFFESIDALTPGVLNGYPNTEPGFRNVYEYRDGEVFLISDGVEPPTGANGTTEFISVTKDGGALFLTADSLVPQDTNTQNSIYDALIEGGFPAPTVPNACVGEACRGAQSVAGTPVSSATTGSLGAGNVHPAKRQARKRKAVTRKRRSKRKHRSTRGKASGRRGSSGMAAHRSRGR